MARVLATAADNGGVVLAQTGDEIVVQLSESPGTGYRWQLDGLPGELALISDDFQQAGGSGIGGGGLRVFRFQARRTGLAELLLKRGREWEGEAGVLERYRIAVRIS